LKLDIVLFVHLYLADMSHFAAANGAYRRHFPAVSPAARACLEVHLPPGCPVMLQVLLPSTVEGKYHGQLRAKSTKVTCLSPPIVANDFAQKRTNSETCVALANTCSPQLFKL